MEGRPDASLSYGSRSRARSCSRRGSSHAHASTFGRPFTMCLLRMDDSAMPALCLNAGGRQAGAEVKFHTFGLGPSMLWLWPMAAHAIALLKA